MLDRLRNKLRWKIKQVAAGDSQYYGDGGTVHDTAWLDVETHKGTVVAVWFRCRALPFLQTEVDGYRATEMERLTYSPEVRGIQITGIEFK